MSIAVANRYARALADVLGQKGDFRQVEQELGNLAIVYRESLELREIFTTPAVSLDDKTKVLRAIAGRLGISHVTTNFLRVLLAHYRMGLLPHIREAFRRMANEFLGVVQVRVTSAVALSELERQALRARFSELTGRQMEMEYFIDERLLGGVRAQIESTVYDGSIRSQLERIRMQLTTQ